MAHASGRGDRDEIGSLARMTEMGQCTNALARELNVAASGMNMTV
jgi:hypothetical protein